MAGDPRQPQGDATQVIRERAIPIDQRSLEERAKEFVERYGPDLVNSYGHNGLSRVGLGKLKNILGGRGYFVISSVRLKGDARFLLDHIEGYARIGNGFIEVFFDEDILGGITLLYRPDPGFSYARFNNAKELINFVQDYQDRGARFSKGRDIRAKLQKYPWCNADNRTKIKYALGLEEPPAPLKEKEEDAQAQARVEDSTDSPAVKQFFSEATPAK